MALPKVRKKPTNKELAGAIIENNKRINECIQFLNRIDNVLGLYIDYSKDTKEFADFVVNKMKEAKQKNEKENDTKTNENLDKQDIQGDTKSKGAGAERVRKKGK
jgi:pentose-5-phosphate-3-epimerase